MNLRSELSAQGLDAGAHTIAWHLQQHHQIAVSPSTIRRRLTELGLVDANPKKRPRSSYVRFEADLPNETWQSDFCHWRLSDESTVEIITWLDDCSRYALSVTAHRRITGPIVVDTFDQTCADHGFPASTLTDNAMVYTTRLSGGRGGRNALETLLADLGIEQKNSAPNHPTTCGKVERFQQTLKKWLKAQPPATTIDQLQTLIDQFTRHYNHKPPPPQPRPQNTRRRLQPTPQSNTRQQRHRHPLQSPTRPHRQIRHRHTAPQRQTPPHRHRQSPQTHPNHPPRSRPPHQSHRHPNRRTPTPPNPRPNPRLPTPTQNLKTPHRAGSHLSYVLTHHTSILVGYEPTTPSPAGGETLVRTPTEHSPPLGACRILAERSPLSLWAVVMFVGYERTTPSPAGAATASGNLTPRRESSRPSLSGLVMFVGYEPTAPSPAGAATATGNLTPRRENSKPLPRAVATLAECNPTMPPCVGEGA